MRNILKERNQDMDVIHKRARAFHLKKKKPHLERRDYSSRSKVTYDSPSNIHVMTRSILTKAARQSGVELAGLVYTGMPKLKERLQTKRSVMRQVRDYLKQK